MRTGAERTDDPVTLARARGGDLAAANALIDRAISTWGLTERLARLVRAPCHYAEADLDVMEIVVVRLRGAVVAVAAWEPADASDWPGARPALLLHGLYVEPVRHRAGLGTLLVGEALDATRRRGLETLVAKAQRQAQEFFVASGFMPFPVEDRRTPASTRTPAPYPHRFWRSASIAPAGTRCGEAASRTRCSRPAGADRGSCA